MTSDSGVLENATMVASSADDVMGQLKQCAFVVGTSVCILMTIVGNILVILSVFSYKPLHCVQNFFIVSLAVADILVAVTVMPFHILLSILDKWVFGEFICNVWLTCDILMCTASILNLCAIAVDRYQAIHNPWTYAQKRTSRRVALTIGAVWVGSAIVSVPPLLGWNNSSGRSLYNREARTCELTNERSFVVYSSLGSFYIPLAIMTFVYIKIYLATRERLRRRAQQQAAAHHRLANAVGSHIRTLSKKTQLQQAARNDNNGTIKRHASQSRHSSSELLEGDVILGSIQIECGSSVTDATQARSSSSDNNSRRSKKCRRHSSKASSNTMTSAEAEGHERSSSDYNDYVTNEMKTIKNRESEGESDKEDGHESETKVLSGDAEPRHAAANEIITLNQKKCEVRVMSVKQARRQHHQQTNQDLHHHHHERQKISLSKERRAARTMSVIMGVFVLCWLPFFLTYVALPFCERCQEKMDPRVIHFFIWLGYVNSALNPVIYTIFNIDFRRAFTRLVYCNCSFR